MYWVWMALRILSASEPNFRCNPEVLPAGQWKTRFQVIGIGIWHDTIPWAEHNSCPPHNLCCGILGGITGFFQDHSNNSEWGSPENLAPNNFRGPSWKMQNKRTFFSNNHGSVDFESSKTMGFLFRSSHHPIQFTPFAHRVGRFFFTEPVPWIPRCWWEVRDASRLWSFVAWNKEWHVFFLFSQADDCILLLVVRICKMHSCNMHSYILEYHWRNRCILNTHNFSQHSSPRKTSKKKRTSN